MPLVTQYHGCLPDKRHNMLLFGGVVVVLGGSLHKVLTTQVRVAPPFFSKVLLFLPVIVQIADVHLLPTSEMKRAVQGRPLHFYLYSIIRRR